MLCQANIKHLPLPDESMAVPTRPVLRYYGGKWRLAPWIISHFPAHTTYVEPFCGAASVFLRKPPAEIEIINDLDGDVINFFHILRTRSDDLIQMILSTPYSRAEYDAAWESVSDPLERARRYYVRAWQGWSGGKKSRASGWRYQHSNNRGKSIVRDWNQVEHLPAIVQRLKQAFIENDDALRVIERYDQPHTLFYLDPPYLEETRSKRWATVAYRHETDESYHRLLLAGIHDLQGMVVISGYPSGLYDDELSSWRRATTTARTTNPGKMAVEVIWISPNCRNSALLPLFKGMTDDTS